MCEYPAFCLDVRESLTYSSYDHTSLPAGSEEQPWRTTLGHQWGTSAACAAQLACRRATAVVAHRAIATTDSPHSELRAFHRSPTRSSSRCSTAPRGVGWSTGAELRRDTLGALLRAGLVTGCGAYEVELTPLGLRVLVCVAPRLLEPHRDAGWSRPRRRAS